MLEESIEESVEGSVVDININTNPVKRKIGEEEWNDASEELAKEWANSAFEASSAHNIAGKTHKCKHVAIGLPAILIPIFMAPISATLADHEGIQYANMLGFLASGCLSAVHSFFGFDRKYQQHMDFSARYSDICSDVKYELVKSRRYRVSSDQFLMRIQLKMDALGGSAPDL